MSKFAAGCCRCTDTIVRERVLEGNPNELRLAIQWALKQGYTIEASTAPKDTGTGMWYLRCRYDADTVKPFILILQ